VVAYVGDGANRWPAAHVLDVAKLYAFVLDKGEKGARYNAVAEEGVSARAIAEVVAAGLGLPTLSLTQEQANDHFGWFGMFASLDMLASSDWTRAQLGWNPTGPGLIADLEAMDYAPGLVAA
jgi:nucleoside-diphosphate-sugar epimerase